MAPCVTELAEIVPARTPFARISPETVDEPLIVPKILPNSRNPVTVEDPFTVPLILPYARMSAETVEDVETVTLTTPRPISCPLVEVDPSAVPVILP